MKSGTHHTSEKGSLIAKSGFKNEEVVVSKFNNYLLDTDAQEWLIYMGYTVSEIIRLTAKIIPASVKQKVKQHVQTMKLQKADAQISIEIVIEGIVYFENISIKKSGANFGQIDKRRVQEYQILWGFSEENKNWLELVSGEADLLNNNLSARCQITSNSKKYITFQEIPATEMHDILNFFNANKVRILSDIISGRGGLSADYFLVTVFNENNITGYFISRTIEIINFYNKYDFYLSKGGTTLKIGPTGGEISLQRKGGDNGRETANRLQFKIKPQSIAEFVAGHKKQFYLKGDV